MAVGTAFVIAALAVFCSVKCQGMGRNHSAHQCEVEKSVETAYIGWPFLLRCEDLAYECALYEYEGTAHCSMTFTESGKLIYNTSYNSQDYDWYPTNDLNYQLHVEKDTPSEIQVKVWVSDENGLTGSCCSRLISLQTKALQNRTCKEYLNASGSVIARNMEHGGLVLFPCETIEGLQPYLNVNNYNVTWYYNCTKKLPRGVVKESNTVLAISSTHYALHPGVYSCSVTSNGQERFIVAHQFCVEPSSFSSSISLRCPEVSKYDEGDTTKITCQGKVGDSGRDFTYLSRVVPVLEDGKFDESRANLSCLSFYLRNESRNDRVSCTVSYVLQGSEPQCFGYAPPIKRWKEERKKLFSILEVTYLIKDIRDEDSGSFIIEVENLLNHERISDRTMIQKATYPESTALVVGWIIGAIAFLLLIVAFAFWSREKMRYWWKES